MDELGKAYARCETIAAAHYENFRIGSWLMPRGNRRHLAALYAFARGADDLADEPDAPVDRLGALNRWEDELDRAIAGESDEPVFVATAHTLQVKDLDISHLRDLLRAFRYDAAFVPYADYQALRAYCGNSANPVGRLVLRLFDVRDLTADALSDEVCTGLQLANFWQDLSVDLPRGRSTLPLADLDAYPGARLALQSGEANPAFRELMELEIGRTRRSLLCGYELASILPRRAAFEIRCFTGAGLAILDSIAAGVEDLLKHRPIVRSWDQIRIFTGALWPPREIRSAKIALAEVERC